PPSTEPPATSTHTISLRAALPIYEVEQQTDLFFCPGCGAGLDGVPQGAHIGGPHQAGGHTFGGETAHEGGLVLLLGELDALVVRSEEHTSELKSRFDLVCRLLLAT